MKLGVCYLCVCYLVCLLFGVFVILFVITRTTRGLYIGKRIVLCNIIMITLNNNNDLMQYPCFNYRSSSCLK